MYNYRKILIFLVDIPFRVMYDWVIETKVTQSFGLVTRNDSSLYLTNNIIYRLQDA